MDNKSQQTNEADAEDTYLSAWRALTDAELEALYAPGDTEGGAS